MRTQAYNSRNTGAGGFPAVPARAAFEAAALWHAIVAACGNAVARLRQARERAARRVDARETYLRLRELDARTLRDLGLDRSEVYSLALETHGEAELTRRLRNRAPDLPSTLNPEGAFHAFRF